MILTPSHTTLLKDENPKCFQDFFPHPFITQCTSPMCEGCEMTQKLFVP